MNKPLLALLSTLFAGTVLAQAQPTAPAAANADEKPSAAAKAPAKTAAKKSAAKKAKKAKAKRQAAQAEQKPA